MTKSYKILFYSLIWILFSCQEKIEDIRNNVLIFPNSYQINVPPYNYQDSLGREFWIQGDTVLYEWGTDTINNAPTFKWDSIGLDILTVVISKAHLETYNNTITNTGDIIWQWHTGMDEGKEGLVKFSHGKNVINNTIQYDTPVSALDNGKTYYWGIWAWNFPGNKIIFSSQQLEFYVND